MDLDMNFSPPQDEDDGVPEDVCKNMVRMNMWAIKQQVNLNKSFLSAKSYQLYQISDDEACCQVVRYVRKISSRQEL
jgi:hypothetical protein